ncbi:two-component system histidine kinase PnpS [Agrilactobacillus yilanensis]|uniref:histidine kinase n=1 Tax=Agrilactobacillus yilanensis TaxID=2485997 RepID=A0ABW4JBE7_9LACO|nr:ATP-binding protein [Agrilactobacillus yilanensis]
MNRRTPLAKVSLAVFVAILIYIVAIFVTNTVVQNQQEQYLKREAQNYELLSDEKTDVNDWLSHSKITVVTHQNNASSNFKTATQDIISHGLVNKNKPFAKQTISGDVYLAYADYTEVGNPTIFYMEKNSIWSFMPAAFWLLTAVYFLMILGLLIAAQRRRKALRETLDTLIQNVHRIRHKDNPEPLILDLDNVLYPLSEEVNKLDRDVAHLNEKIAARTESFSRLIDHLPMGVMLLDMDGNVQLLNQSMCDLLNIEDTSLPHPFIDDVKTYKLSQMIEHTIRSQRNHHGEVQLVQQSVRYVDANVIQLGQDRVKPQVLVLLYDLTDIRRIEQMQLDFVGNVSHELKTPVTAISGFAETLMQQADMSEEDRNEFIRIIYNESNRLNQLIQDILELSKLDEHFNIKPAEINVKESIQRTLNSLKPAIDKRQLEIDLNGKDDVKLTIDPVQFEQVIKNLLSNAIYYNKPEGKIAINFAEGTENIHISIADTGVGLKEDAQTRIFERFYRVDKSRSYNNGGTGLGLSIVKEIVDNYGGALAVTSQYGVGSTFSIKLPKA